MATSSPKPSSPSPRVVSLGLAVLFLVIGVLTAVLLSRNARDAQTDKIERLFHSQTQSMVGGIEAEVNQLQDEVELVAIRLSESSVFEDLSYPEFLRFTQSLRSHLPFVFSVAYAPRVLHAERAGFENATNALLNDELERLGRARLNFTVPINYAPGQGGTATYQDAVAQPEQPEYYPIVYWSFFPGFEASFLFNTAADSPDNPRRTQVLAAVETRQPQASAPFPLLGTSGVVVVFPVFNIDGAVTGVATVVLLAPGLPELGLSHLAVSNIALSVADVGATNATTTADTPAAPQFLFSVVVDAASGEFLTGDEAAVASIAACAEFSSFTDVDVFGRLWRIHAHSYESFVSSQRSNEPLTILVAVLVLVGGVCLLVIALGVFSAKRHQVMVELSNAAATLQEEKTRSARETFESTLTYLSHELRNPMHAITAALGFLLGSRDPGDMLTDAQRHDTQTIATALEQMQRLVNDILDSARLKAGTLPIKLSTVRPRTIMMALQQMFTPFAPAGVTFFTYVGPSVPEVVLMDDLRVRQVLSNGITNALKFVKSGFVVVQVSKVAGPEDKLLFQVIDSGPGLRGASPKTLLDPTHRLPDSAWPEPPPGAARLLAPPPQPPFPGSGPRRESPKSAWSRGGAGGVASPEARRALSGSGFGLPISLQLSRAMHGWCGLVDRAATSSQSGVVFWALLPYAQVTEDAGDGLGLDLTMSDSPSAPLPSVDAPPATGPHDEPSEEEEVRKPAVAGGQAPPSSAPGPVTSTAPHKARPVSPPQLGLHVLVVDDEAVNRRVATRMLKQLNCTAVALSDGAAVPAALKATDQLPAGVAVPPSVAASASSARKFDVILLDIQMPQMWGDEVSRMLLAAGLSNPPLVAVTGNCSVTEQERYIKDGFSYVLAKPFDVATLGSVLQTVWGHGGTGSGVGGTGSSQ